ncbi:MAG: aspartyl protease family protein [Planctomycetes bacterium]|nr:aspartyl protease family protein [Planctomycetota bacterium]
MERVIKSRGTRRMGRFAVGIELANNRDLLKAEDGELPDEKVRRVRIRGVVDTGASRLVIPKTVVEQLGLKVTGKVGVRYADGRRAVRSVVDNVHVSLLGRSSVFKATVEPKRDSVLIGAIVLEDLDFLVDPQHERLLPRDPKMIISEAE